MVVKAGIVWDVNLRLEKIGYVQWILDSCEKWDAKFKNVPENRYS